MNKNGFSRRFILSITSFAVLRSIPDSLTGEEGCIHENISRSYRNSEHKQWAHKLCVAAIKKKKSFRCYSSPVRHPVWNAFMFPPLRMKNSTAKDSERATAKQMGEKKKQCSSANGEGKKNWLSVFQCEYWCCARFWFLLKAWMEDIPDNAISALTKPRATNETYWRAMNFISTLTHFGSRLVYAMQYIAV